ncbi:MAG: ATP-binding protein [Anaerolineae bacterium]
MTTQERSAIRALIEEARTSQKAALYDRALELSHQAYTDASRIDDFENMAEANLVRGFSSYFQGDYAAALKYGMAVLDTPDLNPSIIMQGHRLVGGIHRQIGDWATALEHYHRQLDWAEETGSKLDQAYAFNGIAGVYDSLEEPATAVPYLERALTLLYAGNDLPNVVGALNTMSRLYERMGDADNSLKMAQQAWETLEGLTSGRTPNIEVQTLIAFARAYLQLGQNESAQAYLYDALAVAITHRMPYPHGEILLLLGDLAARTGDVDEAIRQYSEGLHLLENHQNHRLFSDAYLKLSGLYRDKGEYEKALAVYEKFYDIRQRLFDQESDQRQKSLEVRYHIEVARKDAEIYRQQAMQVEAQRAQQEAAFERITKVRNDLMDTIRHDLKNPLASIRMSVYLLRRATEPEHRNRWLESIDNQVTRIQTLLSDTLDLIKLQSANALILSEHPVVSVIEDVIALHTAAARDKNIVLDFECASDLHVLADRDRLTRVLSNLVSNGIKFANSGSSVHLNADRIHEGEYSGQVLIKVSDTGYGIPADEVAHIFDHFYRVQQDEHLTIEGTGLGLSVVKLIVEQHGGAVWVESEFGKGSTFFVRLCEHAA